MLSSLMKRIPEVTAISVCFCVGLFSCYVVLVPVFSPMLYSSIVLQIVGKLLC